MGTDIHPYAERRSLKGRWEIVRAFRPFNGRNYKFFSWLADVRNDVCVQPLAANRGLPPDASLSVVRRYRKWDHEDMHSISWVTTEELLSFNYDAPLAFYIEANRVGAISNAFGFDHCFAGASTYRTYLGPGYFVELGILERNNVERIIFWFDN